MIPAANRNRKLLPADPIGGDSRLQRRRALEHWWIPVRLERFAQRGARHGIRYVFPMLDRDLLEFAIAIPGAYYRRDNLNRAVFRAAMKSILPDPVRLGKRKLAAYPLEVLRAARARARLLEETDRLGRNPLVRRFVDTDGVSAYLRAIPDEVELIAQINAAFAQGSQIPSDGTLHRTALGLAWYLDVHGGPAR